jgi:hypothetical protein
MLKSIDITGPCPTAPAAPDRAVSQQSRYGPSSAAATTDAAPAPETYADISAVMGTWRLQSHVREVLATGERLNQFGEDPDGYIGYAPDDRMDAIFTRKDRITPADAVPTEEEGVQLLGTMVVYAGTFTLEAEKVTHHIDISWKQAWTGTDQVRFYTLDGNMLSITTAPYKSYFDAKEGRSILVGKRVRSGDRCAVSSEREPSLL